MNAELCGESSDTTLESNIQATRNGLRQLDRRDWSLWITAITMMLVLVVGVYSFTLIPHEGIGRWSHRDIKAASRGLFGIVAVFAVFAIYKQLVITRLRRRLAEQMNMMAALQTRAELFHKLAVLDPLTGLYNRRFVMQHLPVELARAERHPYKLTAVMFDVNGLKQVNDQYSHLAGDLVLREFAAALRRAIRSSDMAVRLGGDEFVAILPECGSDAVPRVLARLQGLHVDFRGESIPVHFSAGWTEYAPGETPEQLLARADEQLYQDKRTGMAQDQARAAQEQRNESEKMEVVGRITSGVVHDFNNLLTIIRGYTQLLLEQLQADPTARQHVASIEKAAERATQLTGQLLAFSRRHASQPKVVGLNSLIAGMELMLGRIVGRAITLSIEPHKDLYPIFADPGQIEQLILNLAANARDNMPNGGRLVLEASNFEIDSEFAASHPGSRPGSYICLSVRDTGEGMDAETRRHIFEPVLTASDPCRSARIGLSGAYGLVKQNGGYIWLDSEPAFGTCVSVFLPRATAVHEHGTESRTVQPAADGTHTILVVEPFDSLRKFMCEFLRVAGYRVLAATTGEEAIDIAAQAGRLDLIVCGVLLPGMCGLEVAEYVARTQPAVEVLYIAGYAEDALLYPEWLQDSTQFLAAPFEPQDFADKVASLLGGKKVQQAAAGSVLSLQ